MIRITRDTRQEMMIPFAHIHHSSFHSNFVLERSDSILVTICSCSEESRLPCRKRFEVRRSTLATQNNFKKKTTMMNSLTHPKNENDYDSKTTSFAQKLRGNPRLSQVEVTAKQASLCKLQAYLVASRMLSELTEQALFTFMDPWNKAWDELDEHFTTKL